MEGLSVAAFQLASFSQTESMTNTFPSKHKELLESRSWLKSFPFVTRLIRCLLGAYDSFLGTF